LAFKWNITKSNEWNRITKAMVLKEGGNFIDDLYDGSLGDGKAIKWRLYYISDNCRG
jgi:hypothetical protein